jgi:hypothetical protein
MSAATSTVSLLADPLARTIFVDAKGGITMGVSFAGLNIGSLSGISSPKMKQFLTKTPYRWENHS